VYLYILLYVTNPQLREIEIPEEIKNQPALIEEEKDEFEARRNKMFGYAIYKRVMLVPGKMVSDWFKHIPEHKPFLHGCGYHFLAPFLGCEFRNYAQELYPLIYPKYAARGIQGNVNVAHFMYDYANFGKTGIFIGGIFMALIIAIFDTVFSFSIVYKFSVNTFYVLMLSSSALTTLLFSGGWGIMLFLFFIFKDELLDNESLSSDLGS
jgi:hypothetical protein